MFTSFDEKVFWKAIEEKDYVRLKVNTVSSMLNDPTFARGETMKVLEILKEKVPEIFEEEITLDYEERLKPSEWDKRYFTKLTYWFQENFAESRVEYIKKVGRVVHEDTARKYDASFNNRPITQTVKQPATPARPTTSSKSAGSTQQKVNPTQAPTAKKRKVPVVGVIAAAVLVLVAVLLVKLLDK